MNLYNKVQRADNFLFKIKVVNDYKWTGGVGKLS